MGRVGTAAHWGQAGDHGLPVADSSRQETTDGDGAHTLGAGHLHTAQHRCPVNEEEGPRKGEPPCPAVSPPGCLLTALG